MPERRLDWRAGVATVGLVAVGALLSLERQRGVGALHTLWAEDGKIFLTDALNRSTLDALFRTYNGYLLVAARTIASVTVLLPVRYAAAALSGGGAVGAAAMAAIGYHASAPHIPSRPVRLALAAFVVLLPGSIREVENNVANLHWYLIYAGFWLLVWTSRRTWDVAVSSVVLAFAALSDPLTVLLLPMAGLRLAFVRDRKRLIPPACFLVALVLQLVAVVTHRSGRFVHHHIAWARTLIGYVHQGLAEAFFQGPGWGANPRHIVVGWIVLAIVLGAMLVTAFLRPNRAPLLTLLVVMSFVFYVVPVRISGFGASVLGAARLVRHHRPWRVRERSAECSRHCEASPPTAGVRLRTPRRRRPRSGPELPRIWSAGQGAHLGRRPCDGQGRLCAGRANRGGAHQPASETWLLARDVAVQPVIHLIGIRFTDCTQVRLRTRPLGRALLARARHHAGTSATMKERRGA